MNVPPSDPAHLRIVTPDESLAGHVAHNKLLSERADDEIWKAIDKHSDVLQVLVFKVTWSLRLQWAVLAFGIASPIAAYLIGTR